MGLGDLAKKFGGTHIQTHLAETKPEVGVCSGPLSQVSNRKKGYFSQVEWVRKLFPGCPTYTSVYTEAGLLTERTVLAHSVYLDDRELETIRRRGNPCFSFKDESPVGG